MCAVAYAFMSVRNITMYVDAVCAKIHISICSDAYIYPGMYYTVRIYVCICAFHHIHHI